MSKAKWPKTLWILSPCDIAKGDYRDEDGRRCLLGWICNQFLDRDDDTDIDLDNSGPAVLKFHDALKYNLVKLGSRCDLHSVIPDHNDKGNLSYGKLAEAWNMTIADFGYVEIDESEWKDYE